MLFTKIGPCSLLVGVALLAPLSIAYSQDDEVSEKQADLHAKRFLSILEKNPQRGTALEKVFVHHLQRGTLDTFIQSLEKRTQLDPNDGTAWMLLGLFESQRRFDSQAIIAFAQAEKLRSEDALPAFYRGQCLLRTGDPIAAVEAFESATLRKPTRIVMLELFEQIGRTHQRQSRHDLALQCWKRMEDMFPDDLRVLEQIANIQKQEGGFQDALLKYERLIDKTKDAYQRTQFRIEATQLRIQLGEREKGLVGLTSILSELKPDGWLYRDVQHKIEEVFLKANDRTGLIQFYEQRLQQSPDEIESMIRLAKFLTQASRVAESNQWMTQAIERAPSRLEIRRSFIEQLLSDQQISAAIEQYRQLSKLDPSNMDILREWGKLVLRDTSGSIEENKKEAARIWNKMLESRTDDALLHIQIADLFVSAQMTDEAEKLFERAIQLAPDETQYREYFGDFLLQQNRREEAFAAWDLIAQGERRSGQSVMRLAEIYHHARQHDKSASLATEACNLNPKDPLAFIRAAKMQSKADRIDDALNSLSIAESLADSEDQRESIVQDQTDILEKSNRLRQQADLLQGKLRTTEKSDRTQLSQKQLLVRYLVRLRRWPEAQMAVTEALLLESKSLPMTIAASEIAEALGDIPKSIETLRRLADMDRRRRQEYLQKIARLQIRFGKPMDAVETAKEVVQAFPSKVEGYEFMAQICFQADKRDLGIETLRKAFRIDPTSMALTLALGNALAESHKQSEAIELYWQTLVKATKIDDKLDLTSRLTKLHQSQNGSNSATRSLEEVLPLIDRFESGKQDPAQRHDFTLCQSQVYQSVSDFENAKRVLEQLLSTRVRDSNVLQQLSKVCDAAGDLEKAIEYQHQLVAVVPGQETESQLANLLRQNGEWDEANAIVVKLLQNERDPDAVLQNIDSLLQRGERELVLQTLEPMLRKQPENWELLFRKGLALAGIDEWNLSQATMEQILALDVERTDTTFRISNPAEKKNRVTADSAIANINSMLPVAKEFETIERSELLNIATGRGGFSDAGAQRGIGSRWSPKTYGEVRWACLAWLVRADAKGVRHPSSWIAKARAQTGNTASLADWMDALAIAKYRQDFDGQIQALCWLIESGESDMNQALLETVYGRQVSEDASENKTQRPLTAAQIEILKSAYASSKNMPTSPSVSPKFAGGMIPQLPSYAWPTYAATNSQYANVRQIRNVYPTPPTSSHQGVGVLQSVINELGFAGQADEAEAFLARLGSTTQAKWQLANLCEYFLRMEQFKEIEQPLVRWFELQLDEFKVNGGLGVSQTRGSASSTSGTATALGNPTEFAGRLIEKYGDEISTDFVVRCVELAIDTSIQQFRNRTFTPVTPAGLSLNAVMSLPQNQNRGINRGLVTRKSNSALASHPWAANFVSEGLDELLLSAGLIKNISDVLQNRIDRAEGIVKPLSMLHLVVSHSSQFQPQEDEKRIVDALQEISKEPECALIAASGLMDRKNFVEARQIAENFETANLQDALSRELIILFASIALDESARIEASLKMLANHKIDSQTALWIYYVLQQSTAKDMARNSGPLAKMLSRGTVVKPQSRTVVPAQPKPSLTARETQVQEMVRLSNDDKKEEAVKIARQIISQPRVFSSERIPMAATSFAFQLKQRSSAIQSRATNASENLDPRKTAFDVLRKHLDLEKLIDETKQRLEAEPKSFVLLERLAELYEQMGPNAQTDAEKFLNEALSVRPHANSLRFHFAEYLRDSRKYSEASDQYLELIRRDASLGLMTVGESQVAFQVCGRTDELLKAIREANFHSVRDQQMLLGVGNFILKSGKCFEVGATILEKLVETDNSLLPHALMNAYYPDEVLYPRLLSFTRDALIPNENDVRGNPWYGLDDIMAQRVSESFFLRRILLCHRKEDVAGELQRSVQVAADRFPSWLAGQVMLAMIAARVEQPEESAKILTALSRNKRLFVECPETVAHELAKLFMDRPETRMTAIKLLEPLCNSQQFQGYDAKDRPIVLLAKTWLAEGQRSKAVSVMMNDTLVSQPRIGASILNPNSVDPVAVDIYKSELMLLLGLPIDGYRLVDIPKNDLPQAWDTRQYSAISSAFKKARQNALDVFERMPGQAAVAELLMDRTIAARKLPALELMFHAPSFKEVAGQSAWIESVLQNVLVRHANAGLLPSIEEELKKLASAHPTDLTVLATDALIRLKLDSPNAMDALNELERSLSEFDLQINDCVARTDRSESILRVPEQIQSIAATWLVARQCYASGKHFDVAERIGNRAVKAARILDEFVIRSRPTPEKNNPVVELGPEAELASIILFEWGRTEIQEGRMEQGVLKWAELAERICSLNDGKLSAEQVDAQSASSKTSEELVWQREPFEWMMLLANSALDLQQLDLSKDIAMQVAKRRLPMNAPFVTGKRRATELEAKSAAQMFHRLLGRWPNDKESASKRFTALTPIFLPRDSDVYLFIQNSNLLEEKPNSLAVSLVESASQSDRLLELGDILDQREPQGASNLSWLILRAQVAVAANDMDGAVKLLERIKKHIHGEKQLTNIAHACHAAIPAFRIEELREAALPILNDFLAASKRTGNYPDVDFSLFPLVREVNEYLKNKSK